MSTVEEIIRVTPESIRVMPTVLYCSVQSSPVQSSPVQSSPILNFQMTCNDKYSTSTGAAITITITIAMLMSTAKANAIVTHPEFLIVT